MTRFRGHHLICLHFFHGEGYSQDFIVNLETSLDSAKLEGIEVCEGVDAICRKCPSLGKAGCGYRENADIEIRKMDMLAIDLLKVHGGMKISWEELRQRLPGIFDQWVKLCCSRCDWKKACEKDDGWILLKG